MEEVRIILKGRIILHTHPIMERKLKIPAGHVIIDDDAFWEIIRILQNIKNGKNRL